MAEAEWQRLVEELAEDLQATLWIRRYKSHVDRIRSMAAPSEKLVYLYLLVSQPQSFTTIRRAMALNKVTVDQALRRLLERGHVELDEWYLYWVVQPQ